jgi:hypothetical protein
LLQLALPPQKKIAEKVSHNIRSFTMDNNIGMYLINQRLKLRKRIKFLLRLYFGWRR